MSPQALKFFVQEPCNHYQTQWLTKQAMEWKIPPWNEIHGLGAQILLKPCPWAMFQQKRQITMKTSCAHTSTTLPEISIDGIRFSRNIFFAELLSSCYSQNYETDPSVPTQIKGYQIDIHVRVSWSRIVFQELPNAIKNIREWNADINQPVLLQGQWAMAIVIILLHEIRILGFNKITFF